MFGTSISSNGKYITTKVHRNLYAVGILTLIAYGLYVFKSSYVIPIDRVTDSSSLLMLGDLVDDKQWDEKDLKKLEQIIINPFSYSDLDLVKIDINNNHMIDNEDVELLQNLYNSNNPYHLSNSGTHPSPKVREFYRYIANNHYIQRPAYNLEHSLIKEGPLAHLADMRTYNGTSTYLEQLHYEIYDEALRFSFIYKSRKDDLSNEEERFINDRLTEVNRLASNQDYYGILLQLILMSEAGETLSTHDQSKFVQDIHRLSYELRRYILSPRYEAFQHGELSWQEVFSDIESFTRSKTGIDTDLQVTDDPRDFTDIRNYVDRIEWQAYKSKVTDDDFHDLISYAQNDRRYLRAVSHTTERYTDRTLENHNLPMMLLFSRAMKAMEGDKKAAVGLLDESIRVPFSWVGSIPDNLRPTSIALEHFLLPGNVEDGSDKSRHWNVFGGLSLYKSPQESFELALKREVIDVRKGDYSSQAMDEFIRDMIANCYGIYHVTSYKSQQ